MCNIRKRSSVVALFSIFAALGVSGIAGTAHAYTVRLLVPPGFSVQAERPHPPKLQASTPQPGQRGGLLRTSRTRC
jgi:hypothetical protein